MCFWLRKCLGFAVGWVWMKTWCLRRGRNMSRIDFGWCFLFFENVEELLLSMFLCAWARVSVCSLHSCICSSVLAYAGMFLRLYVRGNELVYMWSYPRAWALTCVCEMPGKSLTLPIFTPFSPVSLPYEILTHIFVIFSSEHHYIILFTFTSASQYRILRISLESWI